MIGSGSWAIFIWSLKKVSVDVSTFYFSLPEQPDPRQFFVERNFDSVKSEKSFAAAGQREPGKAAEQKPKDASGSREACGDGKFTSSRNPILCKRQRCGPRRRRRRLRDHPVRSADFVVERRQAVERQRRHIRDVIGVAEFRGSEGHRWNGSNIGQSIADDRPEEPNGSLQFHPNNRYLLQFVLKPNLLGNSRSI